MPSYYDIRKRVKHEIIHFLNNKEENEWDEFKRSLLHRYDIGPLTIKRILAIYQVRENTQGGLDNVTPIHDTVPDTNTEEQDTHNRDLPV